ncbi:MAG: hypothetical protein MH219_17965 [Marinobacter sp.]|nr:hypothetical protein [Marinobacter sp.]
MEWINLLACRSSLRRLLGCLTSAEVVYTAISEAQACSASMDLVPRPSGGKPGISYIVKQIASIGKNIISGSTSIYYVCKVKISASYKSEITMALKRNLKC